MKNLTKILFLIGFIFCLVFSLQYPFPALSDNLLWVNASFFLVRFLACIFCMKLLYDFIFKEYLKESFKKASVINFSLLVVCTIYETVKHCIFRNVPEFPLSLLPIEAFLSALVIWFFICKENPKEKKGKYISLAIVILSGVYSIFCETNILIQLINQIK